MASADNAPSVDFTVEPNVRDQKDFMTACTGKVNYATQGVQPTTSLDFRHALTAIRFAVGQNLSWNKTIDKVEIRNAIMKSKYKLSSEFNGTGADWDNTSATRGTATLSGVSVSTSQNPNVTIMGNTGDNYTFYMIPQELTGKGVTVYVHCTDGTEITAPLKGEWKAGTTRTYKLSQTNSTWTYTITATDPSAAAYDQTTTDNYGITSYRQAPDGTQQAVPWKVIGYDANNDGTFSMAEKPAWLTSLSKTESNGGTVADQGTATLTKDVKDFLKERNDGLKNATPLGSASAPYDLSLHDYKGSATPRNTANSYLISAPGYYRIPLVYGNAIKNGNDNPSSYKTSNTGYYILSNFKDHLGNNIDNPWIEKTHGGANSGVNGTKIIWADEKDLVTSPSIAHDASNNAYLDFEIKATDIKSGNAVVAVSKGGVIVWSWHLWFAPKDALDKVPFNVRGIIYNFTKENIGWKPTFWIATTYDKPRTVKVKVEQTIANNGIKQETVINITQNSDIDRTGCCTLYQCGRKDALPGTNAIAPGSIFNENAGKNMSIENGIQNPGNLYTYGNAWSDVNPGYAYINLWSSDYSDPDANITKVTKTVYDPCPAGFNVPDRKPFSDFSGNNRMQNPFGYYTFGVKNFGNNYWTDSTEKEVLFLPATGRRDGAIGWFASSGALEDVRDMGYYWTAEKRYRSEEYAFIYYHNNANIEQYNLHQAFAVRPVAE
ncbi:Uncharacterised protein [uncultured Prevotella sp.]|nr:Uncharacterised protein [uncultured Prevotella sp.]